MMLCFQYQSSHSFSYASFKNFCAKIFYLLNLINQMNTHENFIIIQAKNQTTHNMYI